MTKYEWKKYFFKVEGIVDAARPFRIETRPNNDTLAILTHGFTSSPYLMHNLAEYLAENDIDVEAILLAGHGGSRKMLERTNHHDWIQSVEKILLKNVGKYKNIYMIGHSLGANMSLCLSVDYKQIKGIVALGSSVFIWGERWQRFFLFWYRLFGIKKWKKIWMKDTDINGIKKMGGRIHIPIKSIRQFYKFIDHHTKHELSHVKAPIFIAHSRYDMVSNPRSSYFVFKHVGSKDKELFILDKNNHGILDKTRRDFLFKKIVDFIYKHN